MAYLGFSYAAFQEANQSTIPEMAGVSVEQGIASIQKQGFTNIYVDNLHEGFGLETDSLLVDFLVIDQSKRYVWAPKSIKPAALIYYAVPATALSPSSSLAPQAASATATALPEAPPSSGLSSKQPSGFPDGFQRFLASLNIRWKINSDSALSRPVQYLTTGYVVVLVAQFSNELLYPVSTGTSYLHQPDYKP